MIWLEVLIQLVIYARLSISWIFKMAVKDQPTNLFMITFIGGYLLLSEFVPFLIILAGVCSQYKWPKDAIRDSVTSNGTNLSTMNNRS